MVHLAEGRKQKLFSDDEESSDDDDSCTCLSISGSFCTWQPNEDRMIIQYLREASLHGLKYLGQQGSHILDRIFWLLAILGSVVFSAYLIFIGVVQPMFANPILISFQASEITIDQIPFPAFTICNVNKVKKDVVLELERKLEIYYAFLNNQRTEGDLDFLDRNTTLPAAPEKEFAALQFLAHYCMGPKSFSKCLNYSSRIGKIKYETDLDKHNLSLNREDDVNYRRLIHPILEQAFTNCSEIILLCLWQNKPYSCNDLFFPVTTEFGKCCAFNMMPHYILRNIPKTDPRAFHREQQLNDSVVEAWSKWNIDKNLIDESGNHKDGLELPRHQEKAGMNTGLSFLINPQLSQYHCTGQDSAGFRIQAHSPIEFPHVLDFGKAVSPDSETFVGVRAEITTADKDIEELDMKQRECYFLGEKMLATAKFYTQRNCIDECIANITWKACGCLRHFQPREIHHILCGSETKAECANKMIGKVREDGVTTNCSECRPSCTQIEYSFETSKLPMRKDVPLWRNIQTNREEIWAKENVSLVHVFFTSDYVESRQRKKLYGFMELLANTGGLLGLTLGFSFISVWEPLYFFTIRCFFVRRKAKQMPSVQRNATVSMSNGFMTKSSAWTTQWTAFPEQECNRHKIEERNQATRIIVKAINPNNGIGYYLP